MLILYENLNNFPYKIRYILIHLFDFMDLIPSNKEVIDYIKWSRNNFCMQISTVIMFGEIECKISQYFAPKYIQVLMLDAWFCPFNLKRNSRTDMKIYMFWMSLFRRLFSWSKYMVHTDVSDVLGNSNSKLKSVREREKVSVSWP